MLENVSLIIKSMYQKGYPAEEIAEILETDLQTISLHLGQATENRKKSDIITPAVCNMYQQGVTIQSIAQQLQVSRSTVRFILRKEGLQQHIPSEIEKQAIQLVAQNKTYKEIGQILNVTSKRVGQLLRLNGIGVEYKIIQFHQRKHHFNEQFFDGINTEAKAYWLGFLYADGCVTRNSVLTLALAEKDKDHILKFKEAVQYDGDITYCRKTRSYRIDLCSKHICESLIAHGCVQRKSLILRFPMGNQVPDHLIHHFMRGYFDGDGSVNVPDKSYLSRWSLLGTPQFLDVYEEVLLNHCNNNHKNKRIINPKWNVNTQQIVYGGAQRLKDIYRFLYQDATICLDRKYNEFNKILTRPDDKRRKKSLEH